MIQLQLVYILCYYQTIWTDLEACEQFASCRGEILLSLCYSPTQEKLIINVLKARNLPAMDVNHSSDPYVKIWRVHKREKQEQRRLLCFLNRAFI